jgi:hypothetical protein
MIVDARSFSLTIPDRDIELTLHKRVIIMIVDGKCP